MSVEHVGHAAAASDRGTSSTPSRSARAAIAPTDDVQLVAASPTCSSQLVQQHRGGEAQALDFFVRLAAASRRAACEPSAPQLLIAARTPRPAQVVVGDSLLLGQGRLKRRARAVRVARALEHRPRVRCSCPSGRPCRARPRTPRHRFVRASARSPRPSGAGHVHCPPYSELIYLAVLR